SYAASNSINNISSTLINTFGMVVSGFVSQNYGAKNYLRIRKGVTICLIYSWILAFAVGTVLLVFDRSITGMFVDEWNEALYQNVHTFLTINLPFYLIWVPVPIFRFAIQGMKNTLLPFLSCLVELPMRCLTAWVFGQWWGFAGISLATPAALVAAFLFLTVSYFVVLKRKKREMEGEPGEKFLEPVANSEES
ncbi:MAG: MATE family efflux transporter, partial [Christensenellaceae bacterium]